MVSHASFVAEWGEALILAAYGYAAPNSDPFSHRDAEMHRGTTERSTDHGGYPNCLSRAETLRRREELQSVRQIVGLILSPFLARRRGGDYFATSRTESLHVQGDHPSASCPSHACCPSLRLCGSARVSSCPSNDCQTLLSRRAAETQREADFRSTVRGRQQIFGFCPQQRPLRFPVLAVLCASASPRESVLFLQGVPNPSLPQSR